MAQEMNITEVAKLTGLEVHVLRHMRARERVTLLSGPPFCKTMDALGQTKYVYKRHDVLKWMKRRSFRITAGDAASILNIPRSELLGTYRANLHSWKSPKGQLIINAGKNIFVWIPKLSLEAHRLKKCV